VVLCCALALWLCSCVSCVFGCVLVVSCGE
ncbi:hypothetical protein LINPERHAP1_LOCUS7, partial [Linum perenne]